MPEFIQDTVKQKNILHQDTIKQISDSVTHNKQTPDYISRIQAYVSKPIQQNHISTDPFTVCHRNIIADVTFYDTNNFIRKIDKTFIDRFPVAFTESNRHLHEEERTLLIKHLKDGQEIPAGVFHNDWIISVILMSAFLYAVIRTFSVNMFRGLIKFVIFRGINESVFRDLDGLFHWQSTLFNLASFLNISLFAYFVTRYFDLMPDEIPGIYFWGISLTVIIASLTIRHLLCIVTGNLSGENEAFREYLAGIYQSYRMAGLISFLLVIFISYTAVLPEKIYFLTGLFTIALIYLIRVIRLLLIFINRHISIFYLILYLCALEILPVLILLKYFTGLV
jgi:hypothetical protein